MVVTAHKSMRKIELKLTITLAMGDTSREEVQQKDESIRTK